MCFWQVITVLSSILSIILGIVTHAENFFMAATFKATSALVRFSVLSMSQSGIILYYFYMLATASIFICKRVMVVLLSSSRRH